MPPLHVGWPCPIRPRTASPELGVGFAPRRESAVILFPERRTSCDVGVVAERIVSAARGNGVPRRRHRRRTGHRLQAALPGRGGEAAGLCADGRHRDRRETKQRRDGRNAHLAKRRSAPRRTPRRHPRRLELPDEKIHRLAVDRVLPLRPRLAHAARRRAERAVIQEDDSGIEQEL